MLDLNTAMFISQFQSYQFGFLFRRTFFFFGSHDHVGMLIIVIARLKILLEILVEAVNVDAATRNDNNKL